MNIIDQVNDIILKSLRPGPEACWHPYMCDKIHAIHISHTNRGLYGADMAIAPNMIIKQVFDELNDNKPLKQVEVAA